MFRGFFDSRCKRCNARIGWDGTFRDNPGCLCGWKPDPSDIENDAKALAEFGKLLALDAHTATGGLLQKAREIAGLSKRQACQLLGITMPSLNAIESGAFNPSGKLADKINSTYGIGKGGTE